MLDLIINIKESDKFYVERINIFGNNITHERVIRDNGIDEGVLIIIVKKINK